MAFLESSSSGEEKEKMDFPPGFRFDPLPSELILYVNLKNDHRRLSYEIPEADLYDCRPKDLTGDFEDIFNYKKYYLTKRTRRDQKVKRVKRSTNEGYWKTTSKDKVIKDANNKEVGYHKTFKFFEGKDKPTNWIMHEFRDLQSDSAMNDESTSTHFGKINRYVLCMIYEKGKKCSTNATASTQTGITDIIEEVREGLPHNHSMSIASLPHQANPHQANSPLLDMDLCQNESYDSNLQYNLPSGDGLDILPPGSIENFNGFSASPELPDCDIDDILRKLKEPTWEEAIEEIREGLIPHIQSMSTASPPHQANLPLLDMDLSQNDSYDSNLQYNLPGGDGLDIRLTGSIENFNGFSVSPELPDCDIDDIWRQWNEPNWDEAIEEVRQGFIPHHQSMSTAFPPHQANSLLQDMDLSQNQSYDSNLQHNLPSGGGLDIHLIGSIDNFDEFSTTIELLDNIETIE